MIVIGLFLLVGVLLPLYTMMSKSLEDKDGIFIGLANYAEYFSTPALFLSAINSLYISVIGTIVVLGTTFVYAYALTRTCMPFKWFFKLVAAIPLLTPSLLSGISLVYWFGKQGAAKELLGSTLLTGRAAEGGGFRSPARPATRERSPHHAGLVDGAPR